MVASAVRASTATWTTRSPLANQMAQLGQPLYRKQEPTGYSNSSQEWLNSGGLLARMNFALQLADNKIPGVKVERAAAWRYRAGFAGVSERGSSMTATRRFFLRDSALAMVGVGAAPLWLERALYAADAPAPRKKILVAIFQRGAADGLNVVVPHGEKAYYDLRPTIAIPRPTATRQASRRRHRSRRLLRTASLARAAQAAVRPAASGDRRCGRFARPDALALRRAGLHGIGHARAARRRSDGWMNRALPKAAGKASPVRAVSLGPALPRAMRGSNPAVAMQTIERLPGARRGGRAAVRAACTRRPKDPMMQAAGKETFEAVAMLQSIQRRTYTPAAGAKYPRGTVRPEPAADRAADQERCRRGDGVRRYRRLGPSRERMAAPSEGVLANLLRSSGRRWRPSGRTWATAWTMSWWSP